MFMFTKRTLTEIPLGFAKTSKYQRLPREASGPLWRNWRRDKSWGIPVLGTGAASITTYLAFNHLLSRDTSRAIFHLEFWTQWSEERAGRALGYSRGEVSNRLESEPNPFVPLTPADCQRELLPHWLPSSGPLQGHLRLYTRLCLPCVISFWVTEVLAAIYCQLILKKNSKF